MTSLDTRPRDVLSTRSKVYRASAAEIDKMSDVDLVRAMAAEPTLIKRPLIVSDGKLTTGYDSPQLATLKTQAERESE